ncbi:peptide-methionine (R)-S-oxide reductase [Patescibacteria group bacterium]|nr:MAG: peptide-methionine (R)-S-oxide reductase [Patescibacteria group bacterium]
MNEEELKKKLSPEAYHVLRQAGTEVQFSGEYVRTKERGMYRCAACGAQLFSSDAKFNSGTGWPSFDEALPGAVELRDDSSLGIRRTEVKCKNCGSHLGHVFDDGPKETTGKRYCINSVCLDLQK